MADQGKQRNRLQAWGAPGIMLGTVLLILVVALVLWRAGGERGQGAALSLIGAAITHMIKETQEILKVWLADP
jgi:hypothetical protein